MCSRKSLARRLKKGKWLWKHVDTETPIWRIELAAVEPSESAVSSTSACELVCSYNWRGLGADFYVPGT